MKLYELTQEYQLLAELAESDDGAELALALERIEQALEVKCVGIAKVLASLDSDVDACASEVARLTAKKKRAESNAARLREYVKVNMESRGIHKLKADTFSFSVINNAESVIVDDLALVPDEFKRTTVTESADKRAILDAYKRFGECAPGTHVERGSRLQIK